MDAAAWFGIERHLAMAAEPPITRVPSGGGVNYGKPTAEFNAHNQKVMVETIEACELVRKRITKNLVPMKLVEILLNQRKPFESITILRANFNKQDFGMLIERCVDLLDLPTKQPP
jgi:hypothetical protein